MYTFHLPYGGSRPARYLQSYAFLFNILALSACSMQVRCGTGMLGYIAVTTP